MHFGGRILLGSPINKGEAIVSWSSYITSSPDQPNNRSTGGLNVNLLSVVFQPDTELDKILWQSVMSGNIIQTIEISLQPAADSKAAGVRFVFGKCIAKSAQAFQNPSDGKISTQASFDFETATHFRD